MWYHEQAVLQDMMMPLGTISQADKDVIKTTTQCFANISTFSALCGPELKIWGPPLLLSAGYDATFVKVHENGDTGGRKSDKEQQKVNEEFVKTNPKSCHKRRPRTTTTTSSPLSG